MQGGMKPIIEKVAVPQEYSFSTETVSLPFFKSKWHFHEKTEIILIIDTSGIGFIGDGSAFFSGNTVAIVGSGVPHVWQNHKDYFEPDSGLVARSIVIKFEEDFLGEPFLNLPGNTLIKDLLLNRSKRGMLFRNEAKATLTGLIYEISKTTSDFNRLMLLIRILNIMAGTKDFEYVSSPSYSKVIKSNDYERLDKVFKYVMTNFQQKIELEEIAQIASLSPSAFCKYFKSRTLKTFTQFLNEVRIGHACKLLMDKNVNVNQACYMSGFKYLSYFYRQFQTIHHVTPLKYKRMFFESELNPGLDNQLQDKHNQ